MVQCARGQGIVCEMEIMGIQKAIMSVTHIKSMQTSTMFSSFNRELHSKRADRRAQFRSTQILIQAFIKMT